MTDEKEIRKTLAHIEANIERAEVRRVWREVGEDTIEEYIEVWIRRERKEVEESSDNS